MGYQSGEVKISPNTLYWIQMPVSIGETDKIELLKKDILLIDCNYGIGDLAKLVEKQGKNVAFFYNLDRIFQKSKIENEYSISQNLASFISKYSPDKSIVHTTIIDEKIKNIFRDEGLIYIEKNFNDKQGAVGTVMDLIKPLFSEKDMIRRSFLRINLFPDTKYKIEITSQRLVDPIMGNLKDLSLNGMGLILLDKNDTNKFDLKETISIKIYTPSSILKIPMAFITRKDEHNSEIGVNYNIENRSMVKDETSSFLMKIIYKWIQDIINKYGKLEESDKI